MSTEIKSEPILSQDSMWLYLETKEMPLHIACTCVFDGPIDVRELRAYIESKLPLIPRYRQRPVFPPLHIGPPTWEADPDFDIRQHIHHVVLKKGTKADLEDFVGKALSQVMDRSRPLWDMTIVNGLEGRRCALLTRAHHSLVDGIGGVALMNVLFDTSPKRPRIPKTKPRFKAEPQPDPATRVMSSVLNSYAEMSSKALSVQSAVLDLAEAVLANNPVGSVEQMLRLVPEFAAPVELLYERLPFNKPVLGPRKIAWTELSLDEMKAVKNALGGKLNDVALTVMTLAVRRYAEMHGEKMHRGRLLRYFIPVNIRRPTDLSVGNKISLVPTNLPLDIADPVKLFEAIRQKTEALKRAHVAEIISVVGRCLGATPPMLQMALGLLGNRLPLPPFNMVFTNIPGPQQPLYLLGREMLTYYPYVPIGALMACNVAIESYNGRMYIGLAGDSAGVPDLAKLRDFVDDAFAQLKRKAGLKPAAKRAQAGRVRKLARESDTVPDAAPAPELEKLGARRFFGLTVGHET
jgi:WS/DGAT/MGAT family acyltransferase